MKHNKNINFRPQVMLMSEQNWEDVLNWSKEIEKGNIQWGRRKRKVKRKGNLVTEIARTVKN